jgi:hypothetical protein
VLQVIAEQQAAQQRLMVVPQDQGVEVPFSYKEQQQPPPQQAGGKKVSSAALMQWQGCCFMLYLLQKQHLLPPQHQSGYCVHQHMPETCMWCKGKRLPAPCRYSQADTFKCSLFPGLC